MLIVLYNFFFYSYLYLNEIHLSDLMGYYCSFNKVFRLILLRISRGRYNHCFGEFLARTNRNLLNNWIFHRISLAAFFHQSSLLNSFLQEFWLCLKLTLNFKFTFENWLNDLIGQGFSLVNLDHLLDLFLLVECISASITLV